MDNVNKWLMLAANLGVLAGIVFLAVEIQQNTNALYAESRQSVLTASQNELFKVVENPEVFLSVTKEELLTKEEQVQLSSFLSAVMRAREFSWLQFRDGIIDDTQWETEVQVIKFVLGSSRTNEWWTKVGKFNVSPEFADFVDTEIRNEPVGGNMWEVETNWSTH